MRSSENSASQSLSAFARVFATVVLAMTLWSAVALTPRPAAAQQAEMPRPQLLRVLGDRYAQTPVSLGLASNGEVIEIIATADGATWTILLTMPNGLSRVVISGEHWTPVPHLVDEVSFVAQPAQAQTNAVSRAEVVRLLIERYAETPVSMGLAQNGGVIEVFAARDDSTWTIVLTMPDGTSRVMGAGEAWTPVVQLPHGRNA